MTTAPNGELRRQDFHLQVQQLVSLRALLLGKSIRPQAFTDDTRWGASSIAFTTSARCGPFPTAPSARSHVFQTWSDAMSTLIPPPAVSGAIISLLNRRTSPSR